MTRNGDTVSRWILDGIIKLAFMRFAFPPRWHYDILRALDHFQAAGAPRDERLAEAIETVQSTRRADGRWSQNRWQGRTYFELERLGAPSRWNTLRALRVLKWWNGGALQPSLIGVPQEVAHG